MYTIEEIKNKVSPVAKKHNLAAVYLFGSYARSEATEESDIDLLVNASGSSVKSLFDFGGLRNDFEKQFGSDIDIISQDSLTSGTGNRNVLNKLSEQAINAEKELLYVRA
jgi:predicted nucleotidyltransferase